jgi:hypothetical protein
LKKIQIGKKKMIFSFYAEGADSHDKSMNCYKMAHGRCGPDSGGIAR